MGRQEDENDVAMTSLPSPLIARAKLSVPVNGILVQFKSCVEALQRFCRPLVFYNEGSPFELSFSGSTLLLRVKGRNFLLSTRHQIENAGRREDEVTILVADPKGQLSALSPNEANRVIISDSQQANLADVFIAEYASARDGRDISRCFMELDLVATLDLRRVARDDVVLVFAIGCPTRFTSIDSSWDEDADLTGVSMVSRWSKVYLQQAEPGLLDPQNRLPFTLHPDFKAEIGDPDGFSGSPVFFVWQDAEKQAHLGYAGMVTHANSDGRFMIYEAAHLRQVLVGI